MSDSTTAAPLSKGTAAELSKLPISVYHDSGTIRNYCNSGEPILSKTAAYQGLVLHLLPVYVHLIRALAKARKQGHDHTRTKKQDAGNWRTECYGVAAEFLYLQALEAAGLYPQNYCLLDDKPHPEADFVLNGITFDIKAIPYKSSFLCINEEQRLCPTHQKDFVLPVWFKRPTEAYLFAPIPYGEVATWPLRNGHSAYRSISVELLQPLCSFAEIERSSNR